MKTPQKRTKNESIGDEQQNILCAFLINIISCHILFIVLPTLHVSVTLALNLAHWLFYFLFRIDEGYSL